MLAAGQITAEEARRHPHRHVVARVLGVEPSVAVDTWLLTPSAGSVPPLLRRPDQRGGRRRDRPPDRRGADPQPAAEALVGAADAAGGRDNISVVVIEVVDAAGPAALGRATTGT